MIKETRTIHYDAELAIEAYWLQNVLEPFPDHFHDYYLIGFIEKGARELTCGGQKYRRRPVHSQPPRAARLPLL